MLPDNIKEQCDKFDDKFMEFVLLQIKDYNISSEAVVSVLCYHVCYAFVNASLNFDELISSIKDQWESILKNKTECEDMETKKEKNKVGKVMREFEHGKLHSGSKKGPQVKDRKQAVAIAMSEAGIKKKK